MYSVSDRLSFFVLGDQVGTIHVDVMDPRVLLGAVASPVHLVLDAQIRQYPLADDCLNHVLVIDAAAVVVLQKA
jgi:hypothetical protein